MSNQYQNPTLKIGSTFVVGGKEWTIVDIARDGVIVQRETFKEKLSFDTMANIIKTQ